MRSFHLLWIWCLLWIIWATGEARNSGEIAEGNPDDIENNQHILATIPEPYRITYPVQVRKKGALDLDTRDPDARHKGGHYRHTSIQLTVFGRTLKLRLELNRELLSRGLRQKVNIDAKTQVIQENPVEECYYQGRVRKEPHSIVALSTCNGIRGLIQLRNESYIIQPLEPTVDRNETRFPHVVYRSQEAEKRECANGRGHWSSYKELHIAEHLRSKKIMKSQVEDHAVLRENKYIDLALVCDHSLYEEFNSSVSTTVEYLLQVANILDAYFKLEKVRINVVYVEIWNVKDQFPVSENPRETLHSFLNYRRRTINPSTLEINQQMVEPDVAQFITSQAFINSEVGMAVPDSVCTKRAVAVSQDTNVQDPQQLAGTLAHMISHNLGMQHEQVPCSCPNQQGCIMNTNPLGSGSQHPWLFGTCSEEELRELLMSNLGACLFKKPAERTFKQMCGNGIVERGEECDCQSVEECAKVDPCCDPNTCLLKPWATCRFGDCCYNCTVMPAGTMCRAPETECDVPELCDGATGQCPANALIQDGWPCREGIAHCYRGHCPTRSDQCQNIWGTEAIPADVKCYQRFNPTGNFNGHCGLNVTSGEYLKCRNEHVMCGLLHCAGGTEEPLVGKDFSQTKFVSNEVTYQCKILNGLSEVPIPNVGLIEDGTWCAGGAVCINAHCVPVTALVPGQCPEGANGEICSGHGICTSEIKCFCFPDYAGSDCAIKLNRTTTTSWTTPFIMRPIPTTTTEWVPPPTELTTPPTTSTTEFVKVSKKVTDATTLWLVIVLASVAGGALLILGCCTICYRRRSPHHKDKKDKKNMFGMSILSAGSPLKDKDGSDETRRSNKLISFAQTMPSYRDYKITKAQRRLAGHSETESEHSRTSARDSSEVKVPNTLPLARPPDRGILKNGARTDGNRNRANPSELLPLFEGCRPPEYSPNDGSLTELKMIDSEETGERTRDVAVQEDMGDGDDYSCDNESCCGSSCSSMDKKSDVLTPSDCEGGEEKMAGKGNSSFCGSDISAREMPRDSSSDSLEGAKNRIIKLKNINELLRQIDEQFNTVLKQTQEGTLSPGGSDDLAGSETEADRSYPRNSFYKQSDIEEGYSPPHRSPLLSPNPPTSSDKRSSGVSSSDKRSSNFSASSPEPLPSPSFILSPIRHRSPPRFMSPIHEGMKMPVTSSPKKPVARRRTPPKTGRQTSPSRIPVAVRQRSPTSPTKEKPMDKSPQEAQPQSHVARLRSPHRHTPKSGALFSLPSPGQAQRTTSPTSPKRGGTPHRNAPSPPNFVEPPLNAVPYRGAKTSCSSLTSLPGSPPPVKRDRKDSKASDSPGPSPSPSRMEQVQDRPGSASPPREHGRLQNPYLDNLQSKRGSFSNDGQSISEGYHSDKADSDTIIVREIPPAAKRSELRATPHQRISYTSKTMGSNESVNL